MRYFVILVLLASYGMFAQSDTTKKTTVDTTVSKKKIIIDTVRIQHARLLFDDSYLLRDSTFIWSDYRYAPDFLRVTQPVFTRALGTLGQPEEMLYYGLGFNNLSIMQDGILQNDRTSNTYDFNLLQNEMVKDIELLPLPRGFMYGPVNNIAGMNFASTTRVSNIPYSRLRFYQAPNQEGYVDFRNQQFITRRLSASVEIMNRKKDKGFTNSTVSEWLGSASLLYAVTNSLTLQAQYQVTKNSVSLFGGVDVDSLATISRTVAVTMYDNLLAPVVTPYRYIDQYQNYLRLSAVYNPSQWNQNSVTAYFRDNLVEFNQADPIDTMGVKRLVFNRVSKLFGISGSHRLALSFASLSVTEGLEQSTGQDSYFIGNPKDTRWYVAPELALSLFDSTFQPSGFVKFAKDDRQSYYGYGADLRYKFRSDAMVYFGISQFEKDNSVPGVNLKTQVRTAEASLQYIPNTSTRITLRAFHYSAADSTPATPYLFVNAQKLDTLWSGSKKCNVTGAGLAINWKIGVIQFEGNVNYYYQNGQSGSTSTVPGVYGTAGIYYINTHFDSSLVVKTGFYTNFYSSFTPPVYDAFFTRTIASPGVSSIGRNADLTFFTAGEIAKSAIVYFAWENILDKKFYITPYYPMPSRGLRLGITWQLFN